MQITSRHEIRNMGFKQEERKCSFFSWLIAQCYPGNLSCLWIAWRELGWEIFSETFFSNFSRWIRRSAAICQHLCSFSSFSQASGTCFTYVVLRSVTQKIVLLLPDWQNLENVVFILNIFELRTQIWVEHIYFSSYLLHVSLIEIGQKTKFYNWLSQTGLPRLFTKYN